MSSWKCGVAWKKIYNFLSGLSTNTTGYSAILTEMKAMSTDIKTQLQTKGVLGKAGLQLCACFGKATYLSTFFLVNNYLRKITTCVSIPCGASAVPATKYNAWRFEVSSAGAVTNTRAGATACAYASYASALGAIATLSTNKVGLGTLAVHAGACTFTPGTSFLSGTCTTAAASSYFTDTGSIFSLISTSIACSVPAAVAVDS